MNDRLEPGLYEEIISRRVAELIDAGQSEQEYEDSPLAHGESTGILARYLGELAGEGLRRIDASIRDKDAALLQQIGLVNRIVDVIREESGDEERFRQKELPPAARRLLSVIPRQNVPYVRREKGKGLVRPEISIARSSLFTGSGTEPSLFSELCSEIDSSDRIDFLVSFIKWSGLRMLWSRLRAFADRGGKLRVITTSYMGATDMKAVMELVRLPGCEIRISYDTERTRLHAKAYVFHRRSGFSTAYVGSSNLSNPALTSGLEWNVKVAARELPDTMQKIEATFGNYWNSPEFSRYTEDQQSELADALRSARLQGRGETAERRFFFDLKPYYFQQEILDRLAAEREVRGHFKNLVVAATGTGKTLISAFDYKRFAESRPGERNNLLFVAHREEILKQSRAAYREVLRDANFGELLTGRDKPDTLNHLFTTIQSWNSRDRSGSHPAGTSRDFYDYIVVDEFHHAAAGSYRKLLDYYEPAVFLGLTATPERLDGQDVTEYFDGRIAADMRLPEAIERKLLSPFQYFGVTDQTDLSHLSWTGGQYDRGELGRVYTLEEAGAKRRAALILDAVHRYVTDIDDVKGLGFCVTVEHALYMAAVFNEAGVPAMALHGGSAREERETAKFRLEQGEIRFIFVVDLYNEGVDIPAVNTVLFLRPTESLTVFLQQLGRGLRLHGDKECLTVLDFIGRAHRKYSFAGKFKALLATGRRSLKHEIKQGFPSVPKGCFIELEKVAAGYILDNISRTVGRRSWVIERLADFESDTGRELTLAGFLDYYHMEPGALYKHGSFSRLRVIAGVAEAFDAPDEKRLTAGLARMAGIDSRRWIEFLFGVLEDPAGWQKRTPSLLETRWLNMLDYTIRPHQNGDKGFESWRDCLACLRRNPVLLTELQELLAWRLEQIDFVDQPAGLGPDFPLDLHCSYSRDQLLLAFDDLAPQNMREGVKYLPEHKKDLFLVTLNKSDKEYSESTLYEDYSLSENLFHWQSQSTTSADSPTGQRYIRHRELDQDVLFFVRESKQDEYGNAGNYTFLGLADYVSHEGSRPMSMVWKLRQSIPAKFLKKTDKIQAG